MSMRRSRHTRARADLLILIVALLGTCTVAQGKQSDRNQPININANAFAGSQNSGKITFTGNVEMDQGTFHADGARATGYTDPDDTSQWQRVVLTGSPAHFHQTQDNGSLVRGQAATIDYKVSENTVILTGNAEVVQQGRGEFHGNQLVYNTDTGEIQGTPAAGGRVHITLQPRARPAPARGKTAPTSAAPTSAKPAPTSAPATAPPATARPASVPPAASTPPASASSAAAH